MSTADVHYGTQLPLCTDQVFVWQLTKNVVYKNECIIAKCCPSMWTPKIVE